MKTYIAVLKGKDAFCTEDVRKADTPEQAAVEYWLSYGQPDRCPDREVWVCEIVPGATWIRYRLTQPPTPAIVAEVLP